MRNLNTYLWTLLEIHVLLQLLSVQYLIKKSEYDYVTDLSPELDPISVELVPPFRDHDNQCHNAKDNSDDDKHNNDNNYEKNRSPLALGC